MEIVQQQDGAVLTMKVSGRLDAYWAENLSQALETAVHEGKHRIRLSMADVGYMSSIGIRVLLRFYKQLRTMGGECVVVEPSAAVRSVLELAGLAMLLEGEGGAAAAPAPAVAGPNRSFESAAAEMSQYGLNPGATLKARIVGAPELLASASFHEAHCRVVPFPPHTFGLGLGAIGPGFADCADRFGEFLAAGGLAAYLPTDGTGIPDFLAATGSLVPEVHVLYGLTCTGEPAQLLRFDTKSGKSATPFSEVAAACLAAVGSARAGVVMLAESGGLLGAALRRSPTTGSGGDLFQHPRIREWLSFTPERCHRESLVLIVGVVAAEDDGTLSAFLRPMSQNGSTHGHFHAAVFPYRPLPKGQIDLLSSLSAVTQAETVRGLLHLLHDERPAVGSGESELLRGACWVTPITEIERGL